jgi:CDP-paratose 2-epimerase
VTVAIVTGSGGLIGSEAVRHFAGLGLEVVGIDNDMRRYYFGLDGSTAPNVERLRRDLKASYTHEDVDVRDRDGVAAIFARYGGNIGVVIHAAAQPSHDWAAREPLVDFDVNAVGTLNVLESMRQHSDAAAFVYCSTNKVYGDRPNSLPLVETETRWEIEPGHTYEDGIREEMPIDGCLHSLFGASKTAGDLLVQEYGRYFGLRTACFRGGPLTGPGHAAAELHGFLAYIMRCAVEGRTYNIFGYKGKQVRDSIHSYDVVRAFEAFFRNPRSAAVYNLGGGRHSNVSLLEAVALAEEITGDELETEYHERNRIGDHIWWIGSNARFEADYPDWELTYDVPRILEDIYEANGDRWARSNQPSL